MSSVEVRRRSHGRRQGRKGLWAGLFWRTRPHRLAQRRDWRSIAWRCGWRWRWACCRVSCHFGCLRRRNEAGWSADWAPHTSATFCCRCRRFRRAHPTSTRRSIFVWPASKIQSWRRCLRLRCGWGDLLLSCPPVSWRCHWGGIRWSTRLRSEWSGRYPDRPRGGLAPRTCSSVAATDRCVWKRWIAIPKGTRPAIATFCELYGPFWLT